MRPSLLRKSLIVRMTTPVLEMESATSLPPIRIPSFPKLRDMHLSEEQINSRREVWIFLTSESEKTNRILNFV